jgi:galactokinase
MDQLAAMHGQAGHVLLLDCRSLTVEPVPCDLEAAGLAILVMDTRAPHRHVDGEYAARRSACDAAAARLGVPSLRDVQDRDHTAVLAAVTDEVTRRRVRHVLTENDRVLETAAMLRAGRTAEIGPLLTASHTSLRDDYEVSSDELDVAVDAALSAGALGARMTGGGFGGSAIALVEAHRIEAVSAAVRAAFAARRLTEPVLFSALPSAGAGSEEH